MDEEFDDVVLERGRARARVEAARRRERHRQARLTAFLAVIAVLSGFLVAFASNEAEFSPDAFGEVAAGVLEVFDEHEQSWSVIPVGGEVVYDTTVRTPVTDTARVEVRTGSVTFAVDSQGRVRPGQVDLKQGAVLFEVESFFLGLSESLIARADGAWRMDVTPNPRIAVYDGTASVTHGEAVQGIRGEAHTLRRYEEVRLDRDTMTPPEPLTYTVDDPWDARLAAELLAIDDVVARTADGIERTYGREPRFADFYTAFTVVDDQIGVALGRFDTLVGPGFGPPADVLTAVLVSRLIADRSAITFPEAIDEVDTSRSVGATWGWILVRRSLTADDFVRALDLSLREIANLGDDAPRPAAPSTSGPSPSPSPSASPTDEPTEEPTVEPTRQPTEEPTEEPGGVPTELPEECDTLPSRPDACFSATVDELLELIDEILPPIFGLRQRGASLGRMLVGAFRALR